MLSKRAADKILKAYVQELMKKREEDCDAFLGEAVSEIPVHYKTRKRGLLRRCLIAAIVLTLSFAILVVTSNALGIKLFGFDFFQKDTHTEFVPNENREGLGGYYQPSYIPKGYEEIDSGNVDAEQKEYAYINKEGKVLSIVESYAANPGINLNNEDCTYYKEIVFEYEVHIYDYDYGYSTWLLQKEGTFIMIYGDLSKEEFEKIVQGLKKE